MTSPYWYQFQDWPKLEFRIHNIWMLIAKILLLPETAYNPVWKFHWMSSMTSWMPLIAEVSIFTFCIFFSYESDDRLQWWKIAVFRRDWVPDGPRRSMQGAEHWNQPSKCPWSPPVHIPEDVEWTEGNAAEQTRLLEIWWCQPPPPKLPWCQHPVFPWRQDKGLSAASWNVFLISKLLKIYPSLNDTNAVLTFATAMASTDFTPSIEQNGKKKNILKWVCMQHILTIVLQSNCWPLNGFLMILESRNFNP